MVQQVGAGELGSVGHPPGEQQVLPARPSAQEQLQQWLTAHGTPRQVVLRSRIILASAEGQPESAIAEQLETNRKTVRLWRARFAEEGLECLWQVAPGRGRKPTYAAEKIRAIVDATLQTKPPGLTHWSCRLMAKSQGVSKSTVSNIWRSHQLNQAAPGQALQAVARPEVSGQVDRCRRPLFESSAAGVGELTSKSVRRGSFHSVEDLESAIAGFLAVWNEHPRPFVWTATIESIQQKLSRCRQTLEQIRFSPAVLDRAAVRGRKYCPANSRTLH